MLCGVCIARLISDRVFVNVVHVLTMFQSRRFYLILGLITIVIEAAVGFPAQTPTVFSLSSLSLLNGLRSEIYKNLVNLLFSVMGHVLDTSWSSGNQVDNTQSYNQIL